MDWMWEIRERKEPKMTTCFLLDKCVDEEVTPWIQEEKGEY